jgi:hypothetical protein
MTFTDKFELLKKLECLVAFQSSCLQEGNWEDFDRVQNEIKRLEDKIVYFGKNEARSDN